MDKKYIDAEALKADLTRTRNSLLDIESYTRADTISYCMTRVDVAPAADVAPVRHGRWIVRHIAGEDPYECSLCGNTVNVYGYHHCPHCGAKMDEEVGDHAQD